MNFVDSYDIAGPSAVPEEQTQPSQSLDEEVSAVIGQLGRFWGGFKKQSQAVLETARKDLTEVVSQLTNEPTPTPEDATSDDDDDNTSTPEASRSPDGEDSPPTASTPQETPTTSTSSSSLFSRLQAALPPNLLETARNQLPESIKHVSDNLDLPQLGNSLLSEIQRVQGVTRAQAEEYAPLIRDAMKEAGEALRDAVKILPPETQGELPASSIVWDGGNIWSLQLEPSGSDTGGASTSEEGRRRGSETQSAVTSRAESLLLRLKQDPEIIKRDPATDSSEEYSAWLASDDSPNENDEEDERWSTRVTDLFDDEASGEALKDTFNALVPSEIPEDEFWKRYFFRVHQIEVEEEKRRAIIEGKVDEEEDFSWEDEDEETSATGEPPETSEDITDSTLLQPNPPIARESSEEGFDVVTPGTMSPRGSTADGSEAKESDDDSDWE